MKLFGTKFDNLSELEKDIFYEVISAEEGIGDKEIVEIAKKFNITEKKVENILSKLEKDGYLESEDE